MPSKNRHFVCSNGHASTLIADQYRGKGLYTCPVFVLGRPCEGLVTECGPQGGTLRRSRVTSEFAASTTLQDGAQR